MGSRGAGANRDGKLMVVDGRAAYVLGFNFTSADLKSRSFGVIVKSRRIVKELARLFESDANRIDYAPLVRDLVISPEKRALAARVVSAEGTGQPRHLRSERVG
jgi:phosphatidylserine/phosphatidylglycerophosphate/cardiolipin synthase-like enzyme